VKGTVSGGPLAVRFYSRRPKVIPNTKRMPRGIGFNLRCVSPLDGGAGEGVTNKLKPILLSACL